MPSSCMEHHLLTAAILWRCLLYGTYPFQMEHSDDEVEQRFSRFAPERNQEVQRTVTLGDCGTFTGTTTQAGSQSCTICKTSVTNLRRHVQAAHLPWYFVPELACWACERHCISSRQLQRFHQGCCVFTERLSAWMHTMQDLLITLQQVTMTSSLEDLLHHCKTNNFYPTDPGVTLSPTQETLLEWQERYAGRSETEVTINPLSCPSAILNWTTMHLLLGSLPPEVTREISSFKLRPAQWDEYMVDLVDGHCHLEQLARWERLPIGAAIEATNDRHRPYYVSELLAVVQNCVFPSSWKMDFRSETTHIVTTYGVHPSLAGSSIPWEELEDLMASDGCVGIGECGLDDTHSAEQQEEIFLRQIRLASKLKKPLVLHLRDKPQQKRVFRRALEWLRPVLEREHPIYLHCFTGDRQTFVEWQQVFPRLLVGISWCSTKSPGFHRLARTLPFECVAFESDAPYLPPGHRGKDPTGSPWQIYRQAELVAAERNLPLALVLDRSNSNIASFFKFSYWVIWFGGCC